MKKINQNNLWLSGIAAIALAMVMIRHGRRCIKALVGVFAPRKLQQTVLAGMLILFAACGPGPGGLDGETEDFSITGMFKSGEKTSYFKAQKSDGGRAVSRAVGQNQTQPLSGTLDDGDFTLRLKGFYDEESGVFSLSAVSSIIKYSISGTAEGGATASVATRASATEPFGEPVFVEVSTEVSGADLTANIARGKETEVVAGLNLENCEGVWYHELAPSLIKYIVSDWGITMAYNEGDGWIENGSIGFSEIADDYIIADFTAIEWVPPRDPADFPAYLTSAEGGGYNVISRDVYQNLPQVHEQARIFQILPDYDQVLGVLPVTTKNGIYGVDITYTTEFYGGSVDKPFVLQYRKPNTDGIFNFDEKAFATLEAAVEAAEAGIGAETDSTVDIQGRLPEYYNTKALMLSAAVVKYRDDHHLPSDMSNEEEVDAWQTAFDTFIKGALNSYDPTTYPNVDKMIFPNSPEYFDMLTAWMDIPNFKTVTKYVKWNVSLVGGKLLMKAYYSGTPNTGEEAWYLDDPAYVKNSFNDAKALTTLPGQNLSTYDGSVTTMVR